MTLATVWPLLPSLFIFYFLFLGILLILLYMKFIIVIYFFHITSNGRERNFLLYIYCITFWNISLLFWIIWFQMQIYMIPNLRFIIMSFMFLFSIANFINIETLNLLDKFYLFFCHCLNFILLFCQELIFIACYTFHTTTWIFFLVEYGMCRSWEFLMFDHWKAMVLWQLINDVFHFFLLFDW